MQPTTATEPQKAETCPNCNAEVTFKETEGDVTYYNCVNCGVINLEKEKWKKLLQTEPKIKISEPIKVIPTCHFCKKIFSDKCTGSGFDAHTCEDYDFNNQLGHSEIMLFLVEKRSPHYFIDQYNTPYIYIEDDYVLKTIKTNSRAFKRFLVKHFYRSVGKSPKTERLKDVILTIEAFSENSETRELFNRVASIKTEKGLELWFDLCDKKWRSVKVTSEGWKIVEKTPPIFKKYSHMQPMTTPKCDASDAIDTTCRTLAPLPPSYLSKNNERRGKKVSNSLLVSSLSSQNHLITSSNS